MTADDGDIGHSEGKGPDGLVGVGVLDQGGGVDAGPALRVVVASGRTMPVGRRFGAGGLDAREAAQRSADVRRAKRDGVWLAKRASAAAIGDHLAALVAAHDRGVRLGDAAAGAALDLIGRLAAGEVPIRNGSEAADLLRVLVDVARLESGQATSAALVVHQSAGASARLGELRDRARAVLDVTASTDALAVEDGPSGRAGVGGEEGPSETLPFGGE